MNIDNLDPLTKLDKFIIMKILQSKGITSFDEWNYQDINYSISGYRELSPTSHKREFNPTTIVITFSGGPTEIISLKEYNQSKRDITIDKLLDNKII